MRQKRYPVLLDMEYPPEKHLFQVANAIPLGERAAVLRFLVLLGAEDLGCRVAQSSVAPFSDKTAGVEI